jgi:hypothetical protein
VIIILENFACTLEEVVEETSIKQVFTTKIGDMLPKMKGCTVNFTVKYFKKMVPNFKLAQVTSFNYAVKSGALMSDELTITDVAKHLGVSRKTLSKVLRISCLSNLYLDFKSINSTPL